MQRELGVWGFFEPGLRGEVLRAGCSWNPDVEARRLVRGGGGSREGRVWYAHSAGFEGG